MRIPSIVACVAGLLLVTPLTYADESTTVLMQQKHWKRVRAIAQAKIKASPDDAKANYLMSRVLIAWNDSNAALPYAEKAVKLSPQNAEYHWALAQIVGDQAEKANVFRQI